jgi:hypothetical protein
MFQMAGGAFQVRNVHELRPFPGEFGYFRKQVPGEIAIV